MLTIRDAQLAALAVASDRRFFERLLGYARGEHPDLARSLGDAGLRARVAEAVARADAWGLRAEDETGFAVDLVLRLGDRLDDDPRYGAVRAALGDPALRGEEKFVLASEALAAVPA